jgi:hypothetical protein
MHFFVITKSHTYDTKIIMIGVNFTFLTSLSHSLSFYMYLLSPEGQQT